MKRASPTRRRAGATPSGDVVQMYLAEMSRVPLLTREKEVVLAKQIERGHRTVMVAISHTPSLVQQVMRLAEPLREDERLVRRLVTHRHGDVTGTRLKRRARQVRLQIAEVTAAWDDARTRHATRQRVPPRHRRIAQQAQWQQRRASGRVARLMRRIAFSDAARRDFIEGFRTSAAGVEEAQRAVDVVEQLLRAQTAQTRLTGITRRRARRQLHEAQAVLALMNRAAAPDAGGGTTDARKDRPRRGAGSAGEGRAGQGEPPSGRVDRQEVHRPRPALSGPRTGRQYRAHAGRRQV